MSSRVVTSCFFVDAIGTKVIPAWFAYLQGKGTLDALYGPLSFRHELVPEEEGFAGVARIYSVALADVTITPFLVRARVNIEMLARDSFNVTFDEVRALPRCSCGLLLTWGL